MGRGNMPRRLNKIPRGERGKKAERGKRGGGGGGRGGKGQEMLSCRWGFFYRRGCRRAPEVISLSLPTLLP